ncbi:low-density lipoprotein receptor-related protein 2-like [Pleurodeles waltl]|uniref:low-density lipoprotein receptor-related protein 2-like n=1 Tax=Pleurodeles waltl TaxID=8319 RepID=UPI0037099357
MGCSWKERLLLLLTLLCWNPWSGDAADHFCNVTQQAACGDKCIPFAWLCNGEVDCPDETDEQCEEACHGDTNAFQCDNGKCISNSWNCDGVGDCLDGSDESNCVCKEGKFKCILTPQCIETLEVCNSKSDCDDGSDEASCLETVCLENHWQCKNKACIMEFLKCNGINNCGDSSDEEDCGPLDLCSGDVFKCDGIKCLPESLLCDGKADCSDGMDELSTCGKNCSVDNGGCAQECRNEVWGVRCSCAAGWKLQDDGQSCVDVDECSIEPTPCNQLCNNTIGSFTCECLEGFQLYRGTVCKVSDDATLVLLTGNEELLLVDARTGETQSLVSIKGVPSAVAYDLFRESYFWVDENGKLQVYKIGSNNYTQLYPDVGGVNSISVDWLTGQLFWASRLHRVICAGLSNGLGYVRILEKNISPEQLLVFPTRRCMFWINYGRKENTAIEVAGMDGSDRRVLASVPMEQPVGLTLDYITGRLYWISEYKESIETINLDGRGRLSFPEILKKDQHPVGLAVFEGWFFWAYESQLLFAPRNNLEEMEVLLNSSVSAFTVLHELQQPRSTPSPCVAGVCSHLCLMSPVHIHGYKCACPDGTFLLPSGQCENMKIVFASGKKIKMLEVGFPGDDVKMTLVQELSKNLKLMDVDWKRSLVYWTDTSGQLMRSSGLLGSVQVLPTGGAVCTANVDVGTGNIYWLSCDGKNIQLTRFLGMGTKKLYQAQTTIQHMFLDWRRASLYWIEKSKPLQCMNLSGGDVRDVWNGTMPEVAGVFDIKSNAVLWSANDTGVQSLSLSRGRFFTLTKSWTNELAAAYEPYLASVNETRLILWDRRTMEVFTTVEDTKISKVLILSIDQVRGSDSLCNVGNGGCTTDEICVSSPGGVINCLCPDDHLNCHEVLEPSMDANYPPTTPYCPSRFVPCRDGKECIASEFVCDGERDCEDGSDEEDCFKFCSKQGMFRCFDGKKCFEEQFHCDGVAQCSDGSDELDCWKPTEDCALRCDQNTRCIPRNWICDANPDCFDETDEKDCVRKECSSSKFSCQNGQCISFSMRCDGDNDCEDHSDELNCTVPKPLHCRSGEMNCQSGSGCFLKEWLCDGEVDCEDGTDEKDCKLEAIKCSEFQFPCSSGNQCVPDFWKCDGQKDCTDGSDEEECSPIKCQSNQFQCNTFECIPASMACNGIQNCIDGSDEGAKCSMPCSDMCSQSCYKSPYGPKCGCEKGFRLRSDKKGCIDINECKEFDPPLCSQSCVNKNGTFSCACHPGYLLEPDAKTCKVTGSEPLLLVAIQFDLIIFGLRSLKEDIVLSTEKNQVFSIDYDIAEQKIFWMDLNAESIKWVTVDTKKKGTLVKGIKSDCLAVDWIGRNLYWTDGTAGAILATQMNATWKGVLEYTVVLDEELDQPRSLVLQPLSGLMYWSEIGSPPQIEQAGMDGTNRKVLIKEKLGWPTGLALDLLSWKIFWSDDKFHCIGYANLDGSDIKVIQVKKIQSPFSLTVVEDEIYWSEMKTRTVQRMDKTTGRNSRALLKRHGQPYGLKVMHEVLQPRASNPCLNLGCSHLCLVGPGLKGSCWCFTGMVLASDGKNCIAFKDSTFLLVAFANVITQIYLRKLPASNRKSLPDHNNIQLNNVNAMSSLDYVVRERALYFAVTKGDFIGSSKLKDPGSMPWKKVLLVDDTVISFAVDWMSGNIYWISTRKPYIQVATFNSMYTGVLVSDGLHSPSALVLYPPTGVMCYADLGTEDQKNAPKIECASMDGSRRKVLWKKLKMPVGLVFAETGSRLYWADRLRGVIETVQLDGSKYRMLRSGLRGIGLFTFGEGMLFWTTPFNGTTRLYYSKLELSENYWVQLDQRIVDLKIYSKFSQQGTNGCSENNGECRQLCMPNPEGRVCMCSIGYHTTEDGMGCTEDVKCFERSRPCKDGLRCISEEQVCDGWADCLDKSDETNCDFPEKVKPIPKTSPQTNSPPERMTTLSRQLPTEDARDVVRMSPSVLATSPGQESTTEKYDQNSGSHLDVGFGRNMESVTCTSETCNMRGTCVVEDGKVKCRCEANYRGTFCEEEALAPIAGKLTGVAFAVLLSIVAAAILFAFVKKRKALERTSSTASSTTLTRQVMMENDPDDESLTTAETFVNDAYDAKAIAEEELATPLQSK